MLVKQGFYRGDSIIAANPRIAACAPNNGVRIRGESRAAVIFQHVNYGNAPNGEATAAPHNLTFGTVTLTWGIEMNGNATNDVVDNVDGGSIGISGSSTNGVTVQNSDFGPCDTYGNPFNGQAADCRSSQLDGPGEGKNKICCGGPSGPSNILIKNNVFHDYIYHGGGPHFECWWIAGGHNVTFEGNKFFNCQTNGVSLGDFGNDSNTSGTWIFRNNWCSNSLNQACFKFGQLPYAATMIFRFNSFTPGKTIGDEEPWTGGALGRVIISRNILGSGNCVRGASYSQNLIVPHGSCGPTDRTNVFGYRYEGGRLVPDSGPARSVRASYAYLGARHPLSLATALQRLRRAHVAPPGGWSTSSLAALVRDDVYLGHRLGNQRRQPSLVGRARWRRAQRAVAGV